MSDLVHSRVAIDEGLSLHVVRGGRGAGPPLVLLPALADSWWSWSRVLPELIREHEVLAIDPRGHGDSDRPACCYGVVNAASDLVAVLSRLGIDRAILVGHSGSCFTARRVASTKPGLVAALVLVGSPVALDRERLAGIVEAVGSLTDPIPEAFIRDFQLGAAHQPLPAAFVDGLAREAAKLPARVWGAALEGLLAFRDDEDLARIAAPATLLWGERDSIVSRRDQGHLAGAMKNARLVVLEDTGHSPQWERPEDAAAILIEVARAAAAS